MDGLATEITVSPTEAGISAAETTCLVTETLVQRAETKFWQLKRLSAKTTVADAKFSACSYRNNCFYVPDGCFDGQKICNFEVS